jgi:hypothetical protein
VVGGLALGILERPYGVGRPHRPRVRWLGTISLLQRGEKRKLVRLRVPARRWLSTSGRSPREGSREPVGEKVTEGTSALFALTSGATVPDRIIDELRQYDFEIISTDLPEEQEKQLRGAFAASREGQLTRMSCVH